MRRPGIAVVGTGFIGPVHVEALRRLGLPVQGVLGSTPEKTAAAAAALGLPRGYTSLEEMLADPAVEVVHVASPNRLHLEHVRRALAAGRHVVCEKPLAMNSGETAQLVRLAEASQRVCAVNYNVRFYPLCLEARRRVQSSAFGPVYHVTGAYLQDWLLLETDFNWRLLPPEGGPLRAVADIGTHWLDLVTFILGQPVVEVCADLRTFLPTRLRPRGGALTFQGPRGAAETEPVAVETEDYASILLRFAQGGSGCLSVSQVNAGRKNGLRFEIAGARQALAWNSERPEELWIGHRERPNELLLRDPALVDAAVRPYTDYPGGHAEGFPDSFKQLYRAVYAAIESGRTPAEVPYPTFADGHREVVLCEAIAESHRRRGWVAVAKE